MYYTRERWSSAASHEPMGFFLGKLQLGKQGGCKVLSFSQTWSGPRDLVYQPCINLVLLWYNYIGSTFLVIQGFFTLGC